jgi:para-nitrobenzyl esterase
MNRLFLAASVGLLSMSTQSIAQTAPAAPSATQAPAAQPATQPVAAPEASPAAPAPAHYTTNDTDIGTLLDDPAAKAILDKYIPGMTTSDQIDMARGMTLKAIQPYAADKITDAVLANIDAEFAKLPPKK